MRLSSIVPRQLRTFLPLTILVVSLAGASVVAAAPPPGPYFNGFENFADVDITNYPLEAMSNVTRVASGFDGIPSALGSWHATAGVLSPATPYAFTRYGGYSNAFPVGGYTTSIDIYLEMSKSFGGNDIRFDWSSAINSPAGAHRRDFIFSVGTNGTGGFVMSASNNAPGWPANPGRDPLTISSSGWYSFRHIFRDDGAGVLAVDMSVLSGSSVLKTWTLSDPTDIIGTTVGGNRYGWMVDNGFNSLAIDNVWRSGISIATSKDDCAKGAWASAHRADGSTFKNQGDCVSYVANGK